MIPFVYFAFVISTIGVGAVFGYVTGNWWLFWTTLALILSCTVIFFVLLAGPGFVMWLRGYRDTNGLWRNSAQSDWKTAFSPRSHIERVMVYSIVSQVIPKPSSAVYEWLGSDARRVFTSIEQASRREDGGRFRVGEQLDNIMDSDIRDFDTLLGYFEVASIDASIYAVKEGMPIDYAKAMFP